MKNIFQWDQDSFAVHIDKIDQQHFHLIDLMSKLFERNRANADKSELLSILSELVSYTKKHFLDEEAFLRSIKYPNLKIHAAIHKQLLDRLDEHVATFNDLHLRIPDEFFNFLWYWLSSHIKGVDREYSDFFHESKK
jgi:hemerythrin